MEHIREKGQSGFSLIEVVITIGILAILMKAASPSFGVMIGNQQVRASTEAIIGGVNAARIEALKRNGRVLFEFTSPVAWRVCPVARGTVVCDATQNEILNSSGSDADSTNAKVGTSTDSSTIAPGAFGSALSPTASPGGILFDSFGRPATAPGIANVVRIDIRNNNLTAADERRLVVVVGPTGGARACDPKLTLALNPRGCP